MDIHALFEKAERDGRVGVARKSRPVDARPAAPGEVVVTIIADEGKETQSRPAAAGDMVIRNRCEATGNEEYLVSACTFAERLRRSNRGEGRARLASLPAAGKRLALRGPPVKEGVSCHSRSRHPGRGDGGEAGRRHRAQPRRPSRYLSGRRRLVRVHLRNHQGSGFTIMTLHTLKFARKVSGRLLAPSETSS